MIVYYISKIICSWFVFALPLFRSFQALRRRPFSEPDVDRLMKYWIVIGALMAFEYSVEGLISWFPFYWELKLLLLLFISLPQTQGSTYVYDTWLAPFLSRNETHLDQQIQLAQENFFEFFQSRVQAALDKLTGTRTASGQAGATEPPSAFQNAARSAMSYLTAHGFSLAGKGDAARPASSRAVSGSSQQAASASASSTALHATDANHRASFASDSQSSFTVTPEQVYQSQSSRHSTPKDTTSPAFPEPEHF